MKIGQLDIFKNRLEKLGIDIELISNYPWIYLYKINNRVVKEQYKSNFGFSLVLLPIKPEQSFHFTNISEIFKIIRKYINEDNQEKR